MSSKSNGEAQVTELKRRARSLCEQKDLEGDKKLEVQQAVKDTEQQWRMVLRAVKETQRYRELFEGKLVHKSKLSYRSAA